MANRTNAELHAEIEVIRNETALGGNTRARVADVLTDVADSALPRAGGQMSGNLDCAGYSIKNFDSAHSAANVALVNGTPVNFPAVVLDCTALGLVDAHYYAATVGLRVRMWTSDHAAAGCVEFVEDVRISVAAGVATVTFNRTAIADQRGLVGTAIVGNAVTWVASVGGFTIAVTGSLANITYARWRAWWNSLEDIT